MTCFDEKNIPRPEYPDPCFERESFFNLNGEWYFEIDNAQSGKQRGLQYQKTLKDKIIVPFCPESELSGINNKDFMLCVWYKRELDVKRSDVLGKRVILHFGAADYKTEIWISGVPVGQPHLGGYGSFSYDITDYLTDKENILTVCCHDDTRSPNQASGKQSISYESVVCKYTRTTGIWQTVWYEIVPKERILHAKFIPDTENSSVGVVLELLGTADLTASVYYKGRLVGSVKRKKLFGTACLEIALSELHLWDIGRGELYDVILEFGEDRVKTYFGMRTVELKDGKFYLNGRSVFQRLVLDQGYYSDGIMTAPTEEALVRDIRCALDAGFNGARLHMKIFEPRYLYHADKMGYLVWREYGNSGLDYSDLSNLADLLSEWLNSVKRDINHPCVVTWCPLNETWDYGELKKRADPRFAATMYNETKRLDPSRPCIDTSGLYHGITDIYDVHDYEGNTRAFAEKYEKFKSEGVLMEPENRKGRQKYKGEPFAVSEFGGIGYRLENNTFYTGRRGDWCHSDPTFTEAEFCERYRGFVEPMLQNPRIFCFCYTQLTDVEQEKNGLYTYADRSPKIDMSKIAAINSQKAAVEE